MYNNTANNGDDSGENVASSIWISGLKKQQKRPKIPKRGPGVAELEKILRDQESIDMTDTKNSKEIRGNQYESVNFMTRNLSNEFNPVLSYPGTNQERNNQHSPSMVKQFLERPTSSRSLSIGLQNHFEQPSIQSSYYNSEEYKAAPIIHQGVLQANPLIITKTLNFAFSVYSFFLCYKIILVFLRDAQWGRTLQLNNTKYNSDITVPHEDFPPFTTPEVPAPPMHLFPAALSKGNVLPRQVTEEKVESYHSESSGPDDRPFYNFLGLEDSEGLIDSANSGGREKGRVGIDLNLKL
ncbi:uncharacterized protein LOC114915379 [Cajanus cajan]|uniref:uncharacterized protein LOC114915379 n=1 Tax=Cajanus cajan TaxID=3821 RepID=UPI0010FB6799|nr:uncharacterized protein LOC114915379 [Cajanus cajan]